MVNTKLALFLIICIASVLANTGESINCTVVTAEEEVKCEGVKFTHETSITPSNNLKLFIVYIFVSLGLVIFAGSLLIVLNLQG